MDEKDKNIAIMQPYFFPYIGYFQLVNAVDVFVFYDDVNFIKKGWISRNNFLIGGKAKLFSVPLSSVSQNKLINEVELAIDDKWKQRFFKTLALNYKKAPHYEAVVELIKRVLEAPNKTISDLAIASVKQVAAYLDILTDFETSSIRYANSRGLEKADRLIAITKENGSLNYINPIGGKELYQKEYFDNQSVKLSFIKSQLISYRQFDNEFVQGLSIVDVLMFNNKECVKNQLKNYELV